MNPSADSQTRTAVAGQPPSTRSPGSAPLPSAEALAAVGRREVIRLAGERRRAAQTQLEQAVGRCGIPRRFLDRTFDGYAACTPEQCQALDLFRSYAQRFAQLRPEDISQAINIVNSICCTAAPRETMTEIVCKCLKASPEFHAGFTLHPAASHATKHDSASPSETELRVNLEADWVL